jgi:hypothetical protein
VIGSDLEYTNMVRNEDHASRHGFDADQFASTGTVTCEPQACLLERADEVVAAR